MDIFVYDNASGNIVLNQYEILLVKEFAEMYKPERNITKEDKTGKLRKKAFNEFKYIYLNYDWKSPYSQYSAYERNSAAMIDAELTEEDMKDEIFKAGCKKYDEIQNSSRIWRLLRAQYGIIDKMTIYYENIDLQERDLETGKPIFKAKDVQAEIQATGKTIEGIKILEDAFKREKQAESKTRGDKEPGAFDMY